MITKHVWKGRDNEFSLILESVDPEGIKAPLDTSLVEKVTLEFENSETLEVLNGQENAGIDWWSEELINGELRFALGDFVTAIPSGAYQGRLTIFSLATPDGVVWASFAKRELLLSVHDTNAVVPQVALVK